jgi:hypothetical protein
MRSTTAMSMSAMESLSKAMATTEFLSIFPVTSSPAVEHPKTLAVAYAFCRFFPSWSMSYFEDAKNRIVFGVMVNCFVISSTVWSRFSFIEHAVCVTICVTF